MRKNAQQPTIDFKRDEINRAVNDALTNLNTKMQAATQQLNDQVTRELKNIVTNLQKEVGTKVNEIKSLIPTVPTTQTADDQLPGGKGDELDPKDVDQDELKKGIKVELEHTNDKDLAEEIALDHLAEDPKYYTHLEKVHKESRLQFWRRNYDYLESPYMNIKHTKNAEFLKDLVKLADQLDVRGFTKEADIIDRLIKEAIEEWQYHGYTSPEDYERVKKMRQPELYEKPKEKEVKENVKPETPIRSTDNREFGETLDLLKDLAVWGNGIKRMVRFDDVDYYIETHGRINPDNLVDILDFEKMADFGEVYEKFIESFSITIHNYDPGAQIYITGNKEDLDKLENQELE